MRVLLDECVPRRLAREFADHEVRSAPEMGWAGLENGELLRVAQRRFDVFITVDQNLAFQQSISGFEIAVVVLVARSNDIDDLRPLAPLVLPLLAGLRPGQLVRVGG